VALMFVKNNDSSDKKNNLKGILQMDTYYKPEDLPKFEEIGKEAPDLAKKFFDYYAAV
jgi:hypothetical protein